MPATKEKTYNDAEIAERLKALPGWFYEDGWIRRVYKTDGWPTTLMLVNTVGYLAEAAYHHPEGSPSRRSGASWRRCARRSSRRWRCSRLRSRR